MMNNEITSFAVQVANETGNLLQDFFQLNGVKSSLKADHSLVTQADLEADKLIRKAIRESYPQDGILSEEQNTSYPSGHSCVWVVDPLDGTTNFSLGLHYWGVSIARFRDGHPQTAVVYFPVVDELYAAQRGEGLLLNGVKHFIPEAQKYKSQSFFAHCSRTFQRYQVNIPYKTRSLGAAAYHICAVAKGSAILALETTPKLWDIAGAWLVVKEGGGSITTLKGGKPFPAIPGVEYQNKPFVTLAAANPSLLKKAQQGLIPKNPHRT
ncbi:MAG: inositol monophosphatase family protein [Anaerolineales bacterium]